MTRLTRTWHLALGLACAAPLGQAVQVPAQPQIQAVLPSATIMQAEPSAPAPMRVQLMINPEITADIERLKAQVQRGATTRQATPGATGAAAEAAWWLGLIYLHGAGTSQEPAQAEQWFDTAVRLGHPLAAAGLALCAIDGCARAPSAPTARRWIAELRRTNTPRALYLEWWLESRTAPLTLTPSTEPGSIALVELPARALLTRAATLGDTQARIELGLDFAAAHRWQAALDQFRAAAPRSDTAAANLATVTGILRAQSAPSAVGTTRWQTALQAAKRQHRGEGVPANYNEAIRLYQQAESLGSEEAGRMLALIYSRPTTAGDINVEWMRQLAYLDMEKSVPTLGSPTSIRLLQRDPTPLFDLMPNAWRERFAGATPR